MKKNRSEYFKQYREKNKEKLLEYKKKYNPLYYAANHERINRQKREQYNMPEGRLAARVKYIKYYEQNKEKIILYSKKYYRENHERIITENRDFNKMFGKKKIRRKEKKNLFTTKNEIALHFGVTIESDRIPNSEASI